MRNLEQSMGIWIDEPALRDLALLEKSVETLAASGYGFVRVFLRNSNYSLRSKEVVAAVAHVVKLAHARGMKAVLDCEPHSSAGMDMGREFPEAMASKLVKADVAVVDGHWLIRVEAPRMVGGDSILEGVEAAFLHQDGAMKPFSPSYEVRKETHFIHNGNICREMNYVEGVPLAMKRMLELRGYLEGVASGRFTAYLKFSCRTLCDFWAEGFRKYYELLLDCYKDVPLDGVGWDEPAIDGDWNSYHYGEGFAAAFERLNGYKLAGKLWLLDAPAFSAEAVKVRLDYYRTLNEGLAQAQAALIAKAKSLFGEDLLLGTHHTWQGEGGINDYRSGAVDYFRLNDNMDAGYADCSWWDRASVCYAYALASSLGRLTPSREAEANTWHFKPTVLNSRANIALMDVMNVVWFNIWFGSDSDCIMQEGHYTWPETVKGMKSHQAAQRALKGLSPRCETAIWHGWEGVCAWNKAGLANAQKAFCLNASELFIKRGVPADFIDSRLLAESRVEGKRLVNALGSYKVLVMPYALALPAKAFSVCESFAKAGGLVVFVGTPVAADETGASLASAFASLFEMPALDAARYMAGFDAVCRMPQHRPQRLEVCRELAASLPNKLVSCEGEVHGVSACGGNAVFLTDLDPQERLLEAIEGRLSKDLSLHGGNLIGRLYEGEGAELLALGSWDGHPLRGVVSWRGSLLELEGGTSGVVRRDSKGAFGLVAGALKWRQLA